MNVLTDEQRNSIRASILNSEAEWGSLSVPWRGLTATQVAALTDNELRVYGSWMHSITDAVGQAMVASGLTGNRQMVTNTRTCSGCGGEPGACTCSPTPTGNAEGAEGLEARMVIHATPNGGLYMTTLPEDGDVSELIPAPDPRPAPSYRGAAGPAPVVMNEDGAGPVVSTEYMDRLFRAGLDRRLAFNSQLRSRTDRVVQDATVLGDGLVPGVAPREQRVTVVNRKDLDYLPPVTAEMFGWPR
jgi:hypothetical protein